MTYRVPTISYERIIDLSLPLGQGFGMPTPPGFKRDMQFELEVLRDYDDPGEGTMRGQIVRGVHMRLHAGTHFDAPSHFDKAGKNVSDFPLDVGIGPALVADVSHCGADVKIEIDDLRDALGRDPRAGERLLVRTDWNQRYGTAEWREHSPYLAKEAVEYIGDSGVVLCGIDYCHHVSDPAAPWGYLDRYLGRTDALLIPYLINLDQIPGTECQILVLPINVLDTEAAPVRALALV